MSHIATIEYIDVTSETEALLLEASLIKRFKPFYNLAAKDDKSPYYIHITKEDYPRPIINHDSKGSVAGPFLNSLVAKRILKNFRRVTPFSSTSHTPNRPCFYSHLGLCSPCPGQITSPQERIVYLSQISRLKKLLTGSFVTVKHQLEKDMKRLSSLHSYEAAAIARNQLAALLFLQNMPLSADDYIVNPNLAADIRSHAITTLLTHLHPYYPNLSNISRIEMYDIAHLAGTAATAAMTVAVEGEVNSHYYRHFTIRSKSSQSDVDMMKEVLTRRLKRNDWPPPDLIVLDGGRPQLSAIIPLTSLPLISLAKREEILIIPNSSGFIELKLDRADPGLRLIQRLRDEAHRFSRRLHHKHRSATIK